MRTAPNAFSTNTVNTSTWYKGAVLTFVHHHKYIINTVIRYAVWLNCKLGWVCLNVIVVLEVDSSRSLSVAVAVSVSSWFPLIRQY